MSKSRAGTLLIAAVFSAMCAGAQPLTQGTLRAATAGSAVAECPLKHTAVRAEIAGIVARVRVTQDFRNPLGEKIDAVYRFPLPHDAAVDAMTMHIGGRTIEGLIKRREEARALYDAARSSGRSAALMEQERPNIFSQSVANILPGESVQVVISYVQVLPYEAGSYEFVFPMVVAPRYIPGSPVGRSGGGWADDTHLVPDASRITPPVAPPGMRAGHDIAIEVAIDAGLPIGDLASRTHDVDVQWYSAQRAAVRLREEAAIPNKDFVLRYKTAGAGINEAVLAHRSARGGFFTMILQPPETIGAPDSSPKELIFVLDTSGSMMGFPIEKAKEAMLLALDGLYPQDTFNLITFSGDTEILFPAPVPGTRENVAMAKLFLQTRSGNGGTEMMKAIRAALEPAVETGRVRVVCFMTDGEVGNDFEILSEVRKHPAARVFAFGIGGSVNRFLLDGMARLGRGEVQYVGLQDDGSAAARRFHERVRNPVLTDLAVDWHGLAVTDVAPAAIPDLFGARPVVVTGRYAGPVRGMVTVSGKAGGREVTRQVAIDLPAAESGHDVLPALWARARVADLMTHDYAGAQHGAMRPELQKEITQLGLDYRIATQFTSFVAVEEKLITSGGKSRVVEVPVEMPEGMRHEGVFGPTRGGAGVIGGVPGGVLGGVIAVFGGGMAKKAPPPPPAPPMVAAPIPAARLNSAKLDPELSGLAAAADKTLNVEVQILLRDASAATMAKLKAVGLDVLRSAGSDLQVVGRIETGRLAALAAIDAVRYVVKKR